MDTNAFLAAVVPLILLRITAELRNKTPPTIDPANAHNAFRPPENGLALLKAIKNGDGQQQEQFNTSTTEHNHLPSRVPFVRIHRNRIEHGFMGVDWAIGLLEDPTQLAFVWIVAILLHYPVNTCTTNKLMERNKWGTGLAFTMSVLMNEIVPIMTDVLQQFIKHEDLGNRSVTLICCLADGCTDGCNAVLSDIVDRNRIAHFEATIRTRIETCKEALVGGHVVVKSGDVWDMFVDIMEDSKGKAVTLRGLGHMNRQDPLDASLRAVAVDGFHLTDQDGQDTANIVLHQRHPSAKYVARVVRQLDRINLEVISNIKTLKGWYFKTLIAGISSAYREYNGDRTQLLIDLHTPQGKTAIVAKIKELLLEEVEA